MPNRSSNVFYNGFMRNRRQATSAAHADPDGRALPDGGQVYRGNLSRLAAKVAEQRGLDLGLYRSAYVERRLATRLRVLGLHTYRQYADYLDQHPEEYEMLVDTLTINVTQFFRDSMVFDLFRRDIVPAMIDEKLAHRQRMIRAWSAGCATGEETYSITMSLLEGCGQAKTKFLISVLGTDLDETALETARRATYDTAQLKHIPPALQIKYVELHGDTFKIRPEVTQHVRFRPLNLFVDKPMNVVDVIFCRNVFIYFSREQQAKVLDSFWSALAKGGYLVLGRSEKLSPEAATRFELVNGRERIYRKPPTR